jgi:lauroyl/myristoyl acyltransferase
MSLEKPGGQKVSKPSSFYGPKFWELGLKAVRHAPPAACRRIVGLLAHAYWLWHRQRREVVIRNLVPAFDGDRAQAVKASRELFRNFAEKLVDLWRYENGQPMSDLFSEATGWDHYADAKAAGRGVLLLTCHLGNWELGGPLLAQKGVHLLVLTLAEPGEGFTGMRQAARARWGVETLVIGENPFAFVELIKHLDGGATAALLIDRPPAASAVSVELFGRPFQASIAAAELARASGCVLLPACLVRTARGYASYILPEVAYDRGVLGNRPARQGLTQEIMRAFEPMIRQYPSQWYHFVPIWP